MKVKIYPSKNKDYIEVPPSKSLTHRAIIAASLANGNSIINKVDYSDDINATIEAVIALGAKVDKYSNYLKIKGIEDFSNSTSYFDANQSGSTLRFLIPLFTLTNKKVQIDGHIRLFQRPLDIYEEIFKNQEISFQKEEDKIYIDGKLKPGKYIVKGDVSSQFISGLLFTLPLLDKKSIIEILPPVESISYIDLTIDILELAGIKIIKDENQYYIEGNQKYQPFNYKVEGDFSQMAFFAVLGALNSSINIVGLNKSTHQGDNAIIDIMKKMNIKISEIENGYFVEKSIPIGTDINIKNCPDLGPILTILASFSIGRTRIYNAHRLRLKESNRINDLEKELIKLGVDIKTTDNEILVNGGKDYHSLEILFPSNDHRIFMSLAILATLAKKELIIDNYECVNKSYPNFLNDLDKLGIKVSYLD